MGYVICDAGPAWGLVSAITSTHKWWALCVSVCVCGIHSFSALLFYVHAYQCIQVIWSPQVVFVCSRVLCFTEDSDIPLADQNVLAYESNSRMTAS